MLRLQLTAPEVGQGNNNYDYKEDGSVPFRPDALREYKTVHFDKRYATYQGTSNPLPNLIGPIDYRLRLSCEEDDNKTLFTQVYMPLSQVLKQHGVQFTVACHHPHNQGSEDVGACSCDGHHLMTMVVEEKPEATIGVLLGDDVRSNAIRGRSRFMLGIRDPANAEVFQSALVVAQILGYMRNKAITHGVILTAGRAFFILVVPPQGQGVKRKHDETPPQEGPQYPAPDGTALLDADIHTLMRETAPGIYVSRAFMVNGANFLRRLAAFVIESKKIQEDEALHSALAGRVSAALKGGPPFCEGEEQRYIPTPRRSPGGRSNSSSSLTHSLDAVPWSELEEALDHPVRVLATTLGRERCGRVVVIAWKGIEVAVKVVNIEEGERGRQDDEAFRTEVEAYRRAGAAGLWGVAVPKPFFYSTHDGDDKTGMRALGMEVGGNLPHLNSWTPVMFSQARDCVMRLYQAGVTHSDVQARNFVGLHHHSGGKLVAAIDLEYSLLDGTPMLPDWIWGRQPIGFVSNQPETNGMHG